MAKQRDLYEVIGVARDADRETIQKAYRKLARENHPDLNPGDDAAEARFKDISRAWEVIGDPDKRKNYDEFGEISLDAGFDADKARSSRAAFGDRFGASGYPQGGGLGQEFHFGDLDDLMGGFFGGGAGGRGFKQRGADLETTLQLDFFEALRGGEKRFNFERPSASGRVESESVAFRIPPGVADGGRLRVPGKGSPGSGGGPPGDLWVRLRVKAHSVFRREGKHLLIDLPVSVREALAGAKIEIPTLDGRVTLTVPPGTDSGTRLRLRGKGVPDPSGGAPGDLLVRVEIRVPSDLSSDALEKIDEALGDHEDPEIRKELFS